MRSQGRLAVKILVAVALLISLLPNSSSAAGISAAKQAQINQVVNEVSAKLADNVITLTHDIRVYHWFTLKSKGLEGVGVRHPMYARYAANGMKAFWRVPRKATDSVAGVGLYVALDPYSTKSYGNTVLEITIKKGTRLLKGSFGGLSTKVDAVLKPWLFSFKGSNFSELAPDSPDTDTIARLVAKKLRVVGLSYHYDNDASLVCEDSREVAFVLFSQLDEKGAVRTNWFDVIGLAPRSTRESQEALEAYSRVGNFFESGNEVGRFGIRHHPFPGKYHQLTDEEVTEWREHIFACDNLHPEEKR
jgi:hypothetical protein